jgi:hypothetical protein
LKSLRFDRYALRYALLLPFLTALLCLAFAAGSLQAASLPTRGNTGQALALRAALRALTPPGRHAETFKEMSAPEDLRRASDGRYIYRHELMRPGVIQKGHAAAATASQVDEAVQTYDVFNPPPGFTPTQGPSLTPTNLTPVWTADETMLVFSSNRTATGSIQADGRFHIWAIPVNGGAPNQLTSSSGTAGGGEFFPALSANSNTELAFTSDANSPGTQNLYVIRVIKTTTSITGMTSLTISTNPQAIAQGGLGFSNVQRPAFSPGNSAQIIFSALSTTGTYASHYHLYYLFTDTGGYDPANLSLPAKITDGPADDTDPAFSQDGQLLAFASTAAGLVAPGALSPPDAQGPSSAPNATLLGTASPGTNRSIFLIGGGGRYGFGTLTAASGLPATLPGTDNFGPAWSSLRSNPYTNPAPGSEYIAFARGAAPGQPHDIYYLQVLQNTSAGGETGRSNEAATTAQPTRTPVYQVNAGDVIAGDIFTSFIPGGGQNVYVSDAFVNTPGPIGFTVIGGTAETITPAPVTNTVNDPNTPTQIYLTDRNGASTYTFRNLTPNANYRVRLHLSDPKDTAAGARVFTVSINGFVSTPLGGNGPNIDLVKQAQAAPARIDGLISDASTGASLGNATITVTNASGNAVTTNPTPLTSTATPTTDPSGTTNPINYNGALTFGSYTVTVTPAPGSGYSPASQVVNVGSGAYTRVDFPLSKGTATITGTVTDNNSVPQGGIPITITDDNTGQTLATTTTGSNGAFSVAAPPTPAGDKTDVTVVPVATTGLTVQTQQVTIPTAAPLVFKLAGTSSAAVGTLGGLITNALGGAPLTGATVTVKGAGNTTVAILSTSNTVTSPAAPGGDGGKLNYIANLPTGAYTIVISEPGYGTQTLQKTVVNNAGPPVVSFVRADQALTSPTVPLGQNTAIVEEYTASVSNFNFFNNQFLQSGTITVGFNAVSGDPPIVEGIEILTDSTRLDDGITTAAGSGFGNLVSPFLYQLGSAAAPPHITSALGGVVTNAQGSTSGQVKITFINGGTTTPTSYNLYRTSAVATSVNQPPKSATGTEGNTPYLASVQAVPLLDANGNSIREPNTQQPEFTVIDPQAVQGAEYFYQLTAVFQQSVTPEAAAGPTGAGANAAILLNTDDKAGETTVQGGSQESAQGGNTFDDIYPTWSPFVNVFSIAYSSNRTVTYNDPVSGRSSETAISVAPSGTLSTTGAVGANYAGVLISQVVNLDPPTLLPYSGNEIVHVADQAGNTTRYGITPGQKVIFVARLSSREAGIDNVGSASPGTPGAQVYLQIKNPNGKYQDAQGLEHKVFAKDSDYRTQANNPNINNRLLMDSGSSSQLINGGGYMGKQQFTTSGGGLIFPQNRGSIAGIEGPSAYLTGTALTSTTAPLTNNLIGTISIGRSSLGSVNSEAVADINGKPVTDPDTKAIVTAPPGTDPSLFIPWGPEFECQTVNPAFAANPDPARAVGDTGRSDFRDPYYLAGIDDQQPFSGSPRGVRPTANVFSSTEKFLAPAEWLQMTRLPDSQQDGLGGVLYTVTWTTPATGSDYYLDVIAYDKAVAPAPFAANNANFVPNAAVTVSNGSNWRIYDNIWGFSTASSISNNDILVVSDYALGQKFAATTFGGQRGLLNLVPKLYGAESYVTDVDVNILPNAVYRHQVITGASVNDPSTEVVNLNGYYTPAGDDLSANSLFQRSNFLPFLNGLGVGSYNDTFIDDTGRIDNVPAVHSQLYSIWRILSRGPVPPSVYQAYEPQTVTQPAVNDTNAVPPVNIAAGVTTVANRCILWLSPFTGDVLAGPGSLADSATQTNLRNFVKAGGRLCVSGQNVASTLTQNGQANNTAGGFLPDVLNAKFAKLREGTHLPASSTAAADTRITFSPSYDANLVGSFEELQPGDTLAAVSLSQRLIRLSNNYGGNIFEAIYFPDLRNLASWRTDGSLDQLGPYVQPFPDYSGISGINGNTSSASSNTNSNSVVGQINTVIPGPGAHTDLTLAPFTNQIPPVQYGNVNAANGVGGAGLIYTENPITAAGGTGSKVVYSTFGLEALSSEFYRQTLSFKPNSDIYLVRNVRQGILHNIVSYLRTGSIVGTVRSTTGNGVAGSGVAGVTVYCQSALGPVIPGRGTFSATTDANGSFRIDGIEPGTYTLAAYRTGFIRATSNVGVVFVVEGDTIQQASLSLSSTSPGSITGTVSDSSGKPVAGAAVSFTSSDGQNLSAPPTDARGNYTLSLVPPGTYNGTATKAGFASTATSVVIASNVAKIVNFTLKPGPGAITGRVLDPNGNSLLGASVFVNPGGGGAIITLTTDATGTYSDPALTGGTYTLTATATGFGTSGAISVIVTGGSTTTVPDIQLGTIQNGTLGGLVTGSTSTTPLAGVTLTITSTGTGLAVTPAPVTVGTPTSPAAPSGDGSPINYGPISLPAGAYTITAVKNGITTATQTVSVAADTFSRVDFTGINGLPALHTFVAGLNFLSLPFDYTGSSFDTVFGTLNTAPTGTPSNGTRSHAAVWDPTAGVYALDPTPPADSIRLGVGYWIYLKNGLILSQPGATPTGSVSVALHPFWNQIGVPSTTGITVASLSFRTNGTTLSYANAALSGNHVVSPTLYRFDGSAYQPVASTDTLQPYTAYWIKVFVDTTLVIPTGH